MIALWLYRRALRQQASQLEREAKRLRSLRCVGGNLVHRPGETPRQATARWEREDAWCREQETRSAVAADRMESKARRLRREATAHAVDPS